MAKYKLLIGKHQDERGNFYGPGDIVDSSKDLVAFFGVEKFVKVDDMVVAKFDRPMSAEEQAIQKQIDELQNKLNSSRQSGQPTTTPQSITPQLTTATIEGGIVNKSGGNQNETGKPPAGLRKTSPNDVMLNLDAMSVKELQALAAESEIDVKGETRKDKLIQLLKAATV